jgi:hypothetical protein
LTPSCAARSLKGIRGTLRILGLIAALAAFAALPASAGVSAQLRAAAGSKTFEDSTGEDAQGPEISTVVVSNTNAGLITFKINIPNRATLTEDMLIDIDVDADNNPATGDPDTLGAEYAIELFQSNIALFKWDGKTFSRTATDPPQTSLVFSYAAGPTIKISAAELGNTSRFNFGAIAVSGIVIDPNGDPDFSKARADLAPDSGHGFWNYEVNTTPLKLLAKKFTAGRPRAGSLYTVRLVAARNDTGALVESGQVSCKASVAGKALAARTRRIVNKEARCTWLIPSTARGKTLRGSIAVAHEGKKLTKSFTKTVG